MSVPNAQTQSPGPNDEIEAGFKRIIQASYMHTLRNKFDNMVLYSIQNNERLINTVNTIPSPTASTVAPTASTVSPTASTIQPQSSSPNPGPSSPSQSLHQPLVNCSKLLQNLGIHQHLFHNLEGYDVTKQFSENDDKDTFMMSLQSFVMKNNVAGIYDIFKSYKNKSHSFNTNTFDAKADISNDFTESQKDMGIINQYIKENFSKIFKKIRIISKYGVCKRINGNKLTLTICNTVNPSEDYIYDVPNNTDNTNRGLYKFRTPTSVLIDNTNDIYLKYWVSVRMELIRRGMYTSDYHKQFMEMVNTPFEGINGFMTKIDKMICDINVKLRETEHDRFANTQSLPDDTVDDNLFEKPTEFIVQNITNIQLNDILYALAVFDDIDVGMPGSQANAIENELSELPSRITRMITSYQTLVPLNDIIDNEVQIIHDIINENTPIENLKIDHLCYILDSVYQYLRHMNKDTEIQFINSLNYSRSTHYYDTAHDVGIPTLEYYSQFDKTIVLQTILSEYGKMVGSQFGKFDMIGIRDKRHVIMDKDSRDAGLSKISSTNVPPAKTSWSLWGKGGNVAKNDQNGGHLDMRKIVNTLANKIDRMNENKNKRKKTLHLKPKRTRRKLKIIAQFNNNIKNIF